MKSTINGIKSELELNYYCVVDMMKEAIKTTIITWVPILILVGIWWMW